MFITDKGIVLRRTEIKESDAILTVLTENNGKLRIKARAAKGPRSKTMPAAQVFAYSEFTVFENRGYYTINQADVIETFFGLTKEITALSLAAYFADLVNLVGDMDCPSGDLLRLTLNALYALSNRMYPEDIIKPAFEIRLMAMAGFQPQIASCAECGKQPEKPMLNLTSGVLHCAECRAKIPGAISVPLTAGGLDALRFFLRADLKRLFAYHVSDAEKENINQVAEAYLLAQLEHTFQTLEFYKSLKREPSYE